MSAASDAAAPDAEELEVAGRRVRLTRPGKVLFPEAGFTKRDLVDYYLAVAPALLPHLAGRAVTLARYPEGVDATWWFQSNCPAGGPDWLPLANVRGGRGQLLRFCRLEEPAALAWVANAGAVELHPLLARLDRPTSAHAAVFDLDPTPPAGLLDCCRVALSVRALLAEAGLTALVKTSGAKGLHVFVPLDGSEGFDAAKTLVRAAADRLARAAPDIVSPRLAREERAGKVLVDWRQNAGSLSMVAPYSMRATPLPRVSTPVAWAEVERAAAEGTARALEFGPTDALLRVVRMGDLFEAALHGRQRLPLAAHDDAARRHSQ